MIPDKAINRGGRPKGTTGKKHATTIAREQAEYVIKQRVYDLSSQLISAQASLALGQQFLYKVTKDKKGKEGKPVLIIDPATISRFIAGQFNHTGDDYYFISTIAPDNTAIDSLLNRALGKPKESVDIIVKTFIGMSDEELTEVIVKEQLRLNKQD